MSVAGTQLGTRNNTPEVFKWHAGLNSSVVGYWAHPQWLCLVCDLECRLSTRRGCAFSVVVKTISAVCLITDTNNYIILFKINTLWIILAKDCRKVKLHLMLAVPQKQNIYNVVTVISYAGENIQHKNFLKIYYKILELMTFHVKNIAKSQFGGNLSSKWAT